MKRSILLFAIPAVLLFSFDSVRASDPVATFLRTDMKTDPLGIGNTEPTLSWIIGTDEPNTMQESYEIRAASSLRDLSRRGELLWETGWVASSRSIHVPWEGPPLKSYQRVYWQVRLRDNHGNRGDWSEPAWFETGVLHPEEWRAEWISYPWEEDPSESEPSPYLRKVFSTGGSVSAARLYISARGLYQAEINGDRVGDQQFTPGWTTYRHRIQYQTYDVTGLIREGENALGIVLGDGWYRGNLGWRDNRNVYGDRLSAIAMLQVVYADGSVETLSTDEGWKAGKGAIRASDIYNGEFYDATMEATGWSTPSFDDSGWKAAVVVDAPEAELVAPEGPPVRVTGELEPISVEKTSGGWLVDMGQNMVGRVRISLQGNPGDTIVLRHAEVLDKEGNMYYTNLRSARQTHTFICSGGEETFEPHFTFQGFRYVMVEGYPGELSPERITGRVIHSDMEPAGTFTCSDSLINQLQHNIVWGLKGNFLDVPTDCPQRDERLGWTGDAQVFAPTACFNVDAANFYKKWLKDLAADQLEDGLIHNVIPDVLGGGGATGWADAGVVIPWVVYREYGDLEVLQDQYESMKRWIGYMEEHAGDDYIWQEDWHFGDWLSFDDDHPSYMGAYTTTDLIATAYFAYSSRIVSRVARILEKYDDAERYQELADRVTRAFNQEFVTPNGRLVSHTQTAYTLPLAFGLLDAETAEQSAAHLAGDVEGFGHITTGFLGTPLIAHVLTETGRIDLAYRLLNRKEYPSWLYPVTMGATTIWERWDGQKPDSTFQDPGMNSFNHYAYGAIGEWLYQTVAGINSDPDHPGYKHVVINPQPGGGLTAARATHRSMYGTITSGWERDGESLTMEVGIPANTRATVVVPGEVGDVAINGQPLSGSDFEHEQGEKGVHVYAGSGQYRIATRFRGD